MTRAENALAFCEKTEDRDMIVSLQVFPGKKYI
jgi:hypothetical protein